MPFGNIRPRTMPQLGRQKAPHGVWLDAYEPHLQARLGSIPGSYTPGRNHLQSPCPLPQAPLPARPSLYGAGGLTFQSPPPEQPQQQQQPQPVSNGISDFSTFEYIVLGLVGVIWIMANFLYQSIGSMLKYAASLLGYYQSTVYAATTRNPKSARRRKGDHRHGPLGKRARPRSLIAPKKRPLKSAMRMPVVVAEATPFHAHPNAEDAEVAGYAEVTRAAHENPQGVAKDADGDIQMGGVTPPIRELSPHPQVKASETKTGKRVRFAGLPEVETQNGTASPTALGTTALARKPPVGTEDPLDSREDFRKNFNKTKYKRWIDFLQSQGISVKEYRETLHNELALPTDVIMRLYNQRGETPEHWQTFVVCLSHDGFLGRMGIVVPKYNYGPLPKNWKPDEPPLKISHESPYQQRDGRCCFCHGFKWAGEVETRAIARYGDEVEFRSQHRSAVPYTERELEDSKKGVFDYFWRRCCRESRWDWVFEEPVPNEPGELEWRIPQWDARLRHYRRLKSPHTGEALDEGPLPPQINQPLEWYELQKKLSIQDLAAKLFIDAIGEAGNEELASDLRKMDKERKRTQVQTQFLCVRQVHLVVGESPTKVDNHNNMVKKIAEEKPEKDFDFPVLGTLAAEPPAPGRGCDSKEPALPDSSHITDQEEARRSAAELAKFQIFKKRHELMHWKKAEAHYALEGLDPEELAARQDEYDQNLWKEFLMEGKCLQEEKEQDKRSRMKKERPPIPPMEMPKSGWDRRKIAAKHGIPPIMGEHGTLKERLKEGAAIRHRAKEYKRLRELQLAPGEQRPKPSPISN